MDLTGAENAVERKVDTNYILFPRNSLQKNGKKTRRIADTWKNQDYLVKSTIKIR